MSSARHPVMTFLVVAVIVLGVVIGAQTLAEASAPPVAQASQSKIVGQAGFAYLGGIRLFLAGTLYSRLDPQWHQYGQQSIKDRLDLLPSIRLIQMLNPQMEMPYYYASYVLYLRGRTPDALALAREGIANNPQSGLLRANYVQLLTAQDKKKNLPLMLEQTKMGLDQSAQYSSLDDEFEAYGIFRSVYQIAGDEAMAKSLADAQQRLKQSGTQESGPPGASSGVGGIVNMWQNSMAPAP
jgi:tetratricopeptide (TPR) repeat protein